MTPSSIVSPRLLALASLGLLLVAAAGQAARAADAGQGALVFRRCTACHGIDEPVDRVGPHLMGIVGRTAGTVPGFSYSTALAGAGLVWTEANLDRWVADPQGFIPGNRMAFASLDAADDRADLIAFLGSVPGPDDPPAPPPEPVEVVASAAVAPLLERVAVRFGAAAGRVEPLVRGTTEADALAAFCAGAGGDAPDLLGIARRLRQAELDDCAAAGVEAVSEIRLGHEALVLVTGPPAPQRDIEPVATGTGLVRALEAYQQAVAGGTAAFEAGTAARLKPKAIASMIRGQRRPIFAQVTPRGGGAFYPAGMSSHFALIVGIAGTGQQARLTVNDPYPYPEAANPYLAAGERTGEPGQYQIPYADFRQRLGYRQSVVLR